MYGQRNKKTKGNKMKLLYSSKRKKKRKNKLEKKDKPTKCI